MGNGGKDERGRKMRREGHKREYRERRREGKSGKEMRREGKREMMLVGEEQEGERIR